MMIQPQLPMNWYLWIKLSEFSSTAVPKGLKKTFKKEQQAIQQSAKSGRRSSGYFVVCGLCFLIFLLLAELPVAARDWHERDYRDPFETEFDEPSEQPEPISDPLERLNRLTFAFNDRFYLYLLDPAVSGYEKITPHPVRRSIGNFFSNLIEPVNFVNALFQLEGSAAHNAFGRFLINTTFGLGGLFDVAGEHLEQKPHDFNQTMACWGVGDGFYIVWPFLGPSSLRGTGGMVADGFLDPMNYQEIEVATGGRTLNLLNSSGPYLREYKQLEQFALDPYIAVKDFYESMQPCH